MFNRKSDAVKQGAEKLRVLGEVLADHMEALTAEAGEQAVELQTQWLKTERKLLDAKKRLEQPAAHPPVLHAQ